MATANEPNNRPIEKPMCFAKGRRKKKKRKITGPIKVRFYREDIEGETVIIEIDWTWRPKIPPRYYGTFICGRENCDRRWESSWTWLGRRQKCNKCKKYTFPCDVTELRDKNYWDNNSYRSSWGCSGKKNGEIPFHRKPPKDPHDVQGCEYCRELAKFGINCTELPKQKYGSYDSYLNARNRKNWDEISLMSDDTSSVCSSIENNMASLSDDDDELSQTGFSDISEDLSELNI